MRKVALLLALTLVLVGCAQNKSEPEIKELAKVYFVADTPRGFRLFSEVRAFPKSENLIGSVISQLVSGKLQPLDPDYRNLWGGTNKVNSIGAVNQIATIDLGKISLNVGSEGEMRAIDQIVWTYLELATAVKAVRFTVDGQLIETFAGHVDTSKEFTRAPSYEVLNPLQISSFNEGDQLKNPIRITGEACTFEANVFWRLSSKGKVLKEEATTASAACPDRSGWKVEFAPLQPGSYKFEVIEYSAEDGSLFAVDDKNFVVK